MQRRSNIVAQDRTFSVILEPQPEGGFTVLVPALPEIITEGDTKQEALAMAEDAIRLVLEDRTARGEAIPDDSETRIREITVTVAA
jgi:antitoxin HicB